MCLGFFISFTNIILYPTDVKKTKITELSRNILPCNRLTVRKFSKLIGNLVASFPAVTFRQLQYRQLEIVKITGIKYRYNNIDMKVDIYDEVKTEIQR